MGNTGTTQDWAIGRVWIPRSMVALAVATVGLWLTVALPHDFNPLLQTRWVFSWQDGMPRRALVGTVGLWLSDDGTISYTAMHQAAVVIRAAALVSVAAAAGWLLADKPRPIQAMLAGGVLLSPLGLPALAVALGRVDLLLIVLAVLAAAAIMRGRAAVAAGLLVVAVLVHEAAIVFIGVWLATFAWHRSRQWRESIVVAGPAFTVAVLVTLLPQSGTPATILAALTSRTDVPIQPNPVRAQFWGPLDNVRFTVSWAAGDGTDLAIATVVAAAPAFLLCAAVAAAAWRLLCRADKTLVAVSLSPLAMVPFGADWGRWAMFSVLLCAAALLYVLRGREVRASVAVPVAAAGAVFTALTLGPVTSHVAPWW